MSWTEAFPDGWATTHGLCLAAIMLLMCWMYQRTSGSVSGKLPPGSLGLPFIGETLSLLRESDKFFTKRHQKYGRIFKTHIYGEHTIRVAGTDNVHKILTGENTIVQSRWPYSTRVVSGKFGIFIANGKTHAQSKPFLQSAFTRSKLLQYSGPLQCLVQRHLHQWVRDADVLVTGRCKLLALEVILRMLLGLKPDTIPDLKALSDALDVIQDNLSVLPVNMPGFGMYKALKARRVILSAIKGALHARRSSGPESQEADHPDVLSHILSNYPEEMLTTEAVDDAMYELSTGCLTMANALCLLNLLLCQHPDVLEKVRNEMRQMNLLQSGTELSLDTINSLKYVDSVVKELLRLYPLGQGGMRVALKSFEIDGYTVPQGWSVYYSLEETHRISEYFKDRETFDPDRWRNMDSRRGQSAKALGYYPFGGGTRACPVQHFSRLVLCVFLVELARTCTLQPTTDDFDLVGTPFRFPKNGLPASVLPV